MKNENEEIWKDIKGFEGHYQVSDKGRVRSLKYGKERILKPERTHNGYLRVGLLKNRNRKMFMVHRLVGQAFLSNSHNLPQINHKDEDKTNNRVENLEWCDGKYNMNYGTRTQRVTEKVSKPVLQYSKDGEFIREWKSTHTVERNLGYSKGNISSCCTGKLKWIYGFIWNYK